MKASMVNIDAFYVVEKDNIEKDLLER